MKLIDIVTDNEATQYAKAVRLFVKTPPSRSAHRLLVECSLVLHEGKEKEWRDGYSYRLDRRPDHHGGDQLHIFNRNCAWAYRSTGDRSEPNKYTMPATNTVKDVVAHVFGVPRDIVEANVAEASTSELVVEIIFA